MIRSSAASRSSGGGAGSGCGAGQDLERGDSTTATLVTGGQQVGPHLQVGLRGEGPASKSTRSALLELPRELHSAIFAELNWPAALALRQTCGYFRRTFSARDTAVLAPAYREELLRTDHLTVFPAPCYMCLRVKPESAFDSKQHTYYRNVQEACLRRRCIRCCFAAGGRGMTDGATYTWKGREYVFCSKCGKHRSPKPWWGIPSKPNYCGRCATRRWLERKSVELLIDDGFWAPVYGLAETALAIAALAIIGQAGKTGDIRSNYDFTEVVIAGVYSSLVLLELCGFFAFKIFWSDLARIARIRDRRGAHRRTLKRLRFVMAMQVFTAIAFFLVFIILTFFIRHMATLRLHGVVLLLGLASFAGSTVRHGLCCPPHHPTV